MTNNHPPPRQSLGKEIMMRWIEILNDDGEEIEDGTCPDNCDFTAAFGREPQPGERFIDGKGHDEEAAKADAYFGDITEA